MLKRSTLLALVLISSLIGATLVSAGPNDLPPNGWWTGEVIQNVGDGDSTVMIVPYSQDGNALTPIQRDAVPQYGITEFLPEQFSDMPDGFTGSAVVSAEKDILAIVNITNSPYKDFGTPGGAAKAQYQGTSASDTSTTLLFPLVKNDHVGQTTTFFVQNASDSGSADMTFDFTMQNGYTCTNNPLVIQDVPASSMVAVSPSQAGCGSGFNALGSLTVTSAQPLAGIVVQTATIAPPDDIKSASSTRALAPSMADDTAYAPQIKKFWRNKFTSIQVQNASDTDTIPAGDLQITYVIADCGAPPCNIGPITESNPNPLGPGEMWITIHDNSLPQMPSNTYWSATIHSQSGKNFVGLVTEGSVSGSQPDTKTVSFTLPDSQQSTSISLPSVKENWLGRYAGFQVFSTGNPAVITAQYSYKKMNGQTGTLTVRTKTPQTTFLFYRVSEDGGIQSQLDIVGGGSFSDLAGTLSGVIVTSDQNLVSLVNESCRSCSGLQDNNNYEGFNLP
jgi:hypothetical protein